MKFLQADHMPVFIRLFPRRDFPLEGMCKVCTGESFWGSRNPQGIGQFNTVAFTCQHAERESPKIFNTSFNQKFFLPNKDEVSDMEQSECCRTLCNWVGTR